MRITKLASITIKTDYSTAIAQYLKSKDFEIVLAAGRSPAMTFRMEKATTFTDEVHRFCDPSTRVVASHTALPRLPREQRVFAGDWANDYPEDGEEND
ncbi:hypothetical protein CNMCM8980_004362 [Aspergillus fumigatiaffinis]|uniref:Uncharacterized protein n=1 Tax=Aspergillus fumigatiaffinis TaxID=340414 RepID=A0A8H4MEE0_9EURO|nr:hypothetical protein CNMCM6457_002992 [Aspergillus fumigatiaffinis]KAF4220290.1 hypothetical protein CNMCM5878_001769 [Aspergillus fumigatiaffinis]KAF4241618.1 hypothetical protein CNMCM6805_003892 [Aspergillus fumigatiaffinis]KAF4249096.1 hypothetical protein CNMCM8980_004362 [Aspergillus fumigatiaffinis]